MLTNVVSGPTTKTLGPMADLKQCGESIKWSAWFMAVLQRPYLDLPTIESDNTNVGGRDVGCKWMKIFKIHTFFLNYNKNSNLIRQYLCGSIEDANWKSRIWRNTGYTIPVLMLSISSTFYLSNFNFWRKKMIIRCSIMWIVLSLLKQWKVIRGVSSANVFLIDTSFSVTSFVFHGP